ncbi:chromosome partition protein Smc [Formosimonas limnophila]|uniref:Chromosome partition protein Smc n=1 Tax=Formosimonas limnophila TaxID=1384487 RepID=A0A8J3FYM5_9BURK|nr:chromosome segregation protein SMC [Formosimonas limnophila]GHA74522.1 chromosome partition protein Smc [Formosimonas limnophila]
MRLTQIKLAGFKSFVDPVSFHVPGQLVGVVGPNGCGKSNIMDATRWVLGESKASELRGESMHDVIFNGSGNRKPAARASVELVFDNNDSRVAGQWSQYAEIAVKRVLTRDGGSSYYINNQQVRRRDVQDIFMGTGLGPRAYAIIGQGMIARIIEAKPEELRVFLEEAAGVSKYKERRRETENRLHDTRENLTRVEDILRELNSHVERLQIQATVAQEYRELQNAAQDKLHFLWLLRYDEAQAEQNKIATQISAATNELEGHIANLRHAEAELEVQRARHYELSDAVHAAQGSLYEANTEVSRFEAEIKYITEGRARVQAQMEQIKAQLSQWQNRQSELEDEAHNAVTERELAEQEHAAQAEQLTMDSEEVPELEARHRDALTAMQSAHAQYVQVEQKVARAADDQRNADRQINLLIQRRERLQLEKVAPGQADARELMELEHQLNDATYRQEEAQAKLLDVDERLPQAQDELGSARELAQKEQQRIAQLNARLEALTQLQEKVQAQGQLTPWLEKHNLATRQRLWQKVHIESGWESALEAVLADRMGALELSRMDWAKNFFNDAPPAKLSFYANEVNSVPADISGLTPMMRMVKTHDATLQSLLPQWLHQVYVAPTLDEAYQLREQLPVGGVIVTRDGHQLSKNALRFYVAESEQAGMLARAQEIENIQTQLRAQDLLTDEAQGELARLQSKVDQLNQQQAQARAQAQSCTNLVHDLQMQTQKVKLASEQLMARHAQIDDELAEISLQEEEFLAQKMTAQALFDEGDAHLVEQQAKLQNAQEAYNQLDEQLAKMRAQHREAEHRVRDAQYRVQTLTQRIADIEYNQQSCVQQLEFLQTSLEEQVMLLEEFADVSHHEGLQEALALRVAREEALAQARAAADALTHELRMADEARLTLERGIEPLREAITQLQLKEQAARLNQEQYAEQLSEAEVDKDALRVRLEEVLKDGTRASALQAEITRLNNQINALGPVNLAALDELKAAEERQGFLNAQTADLVEAMTTLEDAINKIDKESRDLLQGTFDTVNKNFGELFPELFGGGEAKLIMTGEEILDSGLQVMAQPPGKRNSTIHLLSGGEKALTAIALVFALFRLNPAPFCLLDEVDAPLDDANTERFANLVKKMSEYTQFLFISHNKIAMEMAQQLIGVTMQEQGVSRVVAVDMESALEMAGL